MKMIKQNFGGEKKIQQTKDFLCKEELFICLLKNTMF